MCEKTLYRRLESNLNLVKAYNCEYFAETNNIKMNMNLLDTKIINGIFIDRSKNLSAHYYDIKESKEKVVYKRKVLDKLNIAQTPNTSTITEEDV